MVESSSASDSVQRPSGEPPDASPLESSLPPMPMQVPRYRRLTARAVQYLAGVYWSLDPADRPEFVHRLLLQSRPNLDLSPLDAFLLDLTPAERRVLRMFVSDASEKMIAQALDLAPKTIASHCYRIRHQLGVHTMRGAVVRYLRVALGEGGGR